MLLPVNARPLLLLMFGWGLLPGQPHIPYCLSLFIPSALSLLGGFTAGWGTDLNFSQTLEQVFIQNEQ